MKRVKGLKPILSICDSCKYVRSLYYKETSGLKQYHCYVYGHPEHLATLDIREEDQKDSLRDVPEICPHILEHTIS